MTKLLSFLLLAVAAISTVGSAFAAPDAGAKARGEYDFYANSAGRSARSARDYSRAYRQYVPTAAAKVNPEVAKAAADSIAHYIKESQKHMAWMRKQAGDDKETLASLDLIDGSLADAAKSHHELHAMCIAANVDAAGSMKCCQQIDASLSAAIAEHDKLMKRLADEKAPAPKN